MQGTKRLEDPSWGAGATRQVRLQNLPPGKRVRRLSLYFDLSGTKGATDALDGDLFAQSVALIQLQSSEGVLWNLTGMETWRLMHCEAGRVVMDPTDIPGSGTTFTMQFQLDLQFRLENQQGSDDGSLPTELFKEHALELTFASANPWGVGTLALTAGNVRVTPELVEETNVPEINICKYVDLASGMALIERGVVKTAFLVQTDYSTITQAEIGLVGFKVDNTVVHEANTMHEQLVTLWNQDRAVQSGNPHELVVNAARFLPLAWGGRQHANFTKQPASESKGEVRIVTGSLTGPRLVLRLARIKTEAEAATLAVMTGAPEGATTYEPAVASKSAVRAVHESQRRGAPTKKARLIYGVAAGKMRRTPTPGRRAGGAE